MYWHTRYVLHAPVLECYSMSSDEKRMDQDILKKLKRKAELCRYCHSEMRSRYTVFRNLKEFSITLLSLLIAALSGLYYRNILANEYVLAAIFLIPLTVALIQALGPHSFPLDNQGRLPSSRCVYMGELDKGGRLSGSQLSATFKC